MILRERVPCQAPLVGLALIGLLAIAILPGWTRGQAPPKQSQGEKRAVEQRMSARKAETRPIADRYAQASVSRLEIQNRKLAEIKQLEARLAALASELRRLRGTEGGGEKPAAQFDELVVAIERDAAPSSIDIIQTSQELFSSRPDSENRHSPNAAGEIENLTRAKYKLPSGRADALAAFIKAQVKEDVETRVDGETLIVTATADDQTRIGQFVQLLKKTPEEPGLRQDNVQGSTFYPSAQPVAVDAGLPAPVGEPVPEIQPVLPASATPSADRVSPLPVLEESGAKSPLPPPADAVPATVD